MKRSIRPFTLLVGVLLAFSTAPMSASAANAWSSPVKVETSGFGLSVSCTSSTFCAAVSGHGTASTYNGGSWSPPVTVETEQLFSVSCASPTFCVAVTNGGDAVTFNGAAWSAPTELAGNATTLESISCTSTTFCVAVGQAAGSGYAVLFNGSTWSAPVKITSSGANVYSVSCTSTTFCVAVDSHGDALIYNGSVWSAPVNIDSPRSLDSVSCTAATFCIAVDDAGRALTYNGSVWSAPVAIGVWKLNSVSCASTSFCVAVDYNGHGIQYDGSSWSVPGEIQNGDIVTSVSCPSVSFCVAVDEFGNAFTLSETQAPPVTPPPPPPPPVVKITSAPPAETAEQKASFAFKGVTGGTYECSIDDGAWARCASGQTFGPLAPGDHLFQVRETLAGLTGPVASYRWTIDLPRACVLRVARARVFAFTHQHRARLVIRYKTYRPAEVTVSYKLAGSKGNLALGSATSHFATAGVFRLPKSLDKGDIAKLRATSSMKVSFSIPEAPNSCNRYYTKRLTIPKKVFGQTVWFQSDSIFTS